WTLYQQYLSTMVVNNFTSYSTGNGLLWIPPNGLFTTISTIDNNFIALTGTAKAGIYYPSEHLKMQNSVILWMMSRIMEINNVYQAQNFCDQSYAFWTETTPN